MKKNERSDFKRRITKAKKVLDPASILKANSRAQIS